LRGRGVGNKKKYSSKASRLKKKKKKKNCARPKCPKNIRIHNYGSEEKIRARVELPNPSPSNI